MSRYSYEFQQPLIVCLTGPDDEEIPAEVIVDFYTEGAPAIIGGPPERCHPEEPSELDWHLISTETGEQLQPSDEEAAEIEQQIYECIATEKQNEKYGDWI